MMQKQHIEVLDFLKGYGMITIVVFHLFQNMGLNGLWDKLINLGGAGVHTFIFISGFGLYLSHLKHPMPFLEFIRKRFLKVYIPYIITVSLIGIIGFVIPFDPYNTWAKYFSHVFLYKMFSETYIGTFGFHFWFISLIFELYLVFPLLVLLKEKMKGSIFITSGIFISISWSILVLLLGKSELRVWNSFFLQYVWEFMLGMYFAEGVNSGKLRFWEMKKSYLFIICFAGLGLKVILPMKLGSAGEILNDIPSLFGYTSLGILIYMLKINPVNRFMIYTGVISFSLYLIHFAIKLLFIYGLNYYGLHYNIVWLMVVFGICYLAAISYDKGIKKLYDLFHY